VSGIKTHKQRTHFAAPMSRSLSCWPQIHHCGMYELGWQRARRASSQGCQSICSLILLSRSMRARHRLARSSVIGKTYKPLGGRAGRHITMHYMTVNKQTTETNTEYYAVAILHYLDALQLTVKQQYNPKDNEAYPALDGHHNAAVSFPSRTRWAVTIVLKIFSKPYQFLLVGCHQINAMKNNDKFHSKLSDEANL